MRAPLVAAVAWLAAGIAVGIQRPVPPGDGPLLVSIALAGAALAGAFAARPGLVGPSAGRRTVVLAVLLAAAGTLLGARVRTVADRSCAAWVPAGVPVELDAVVASVGPGGGVSARRLALQVRRAHVRGRTVSCPGALPARWDGPAPAPGSAVRALGRWWSPPGPAPALRRPGTFLVDSLRSAAPPGPTASARVGLRERARSRIDDVFPATAPLVASLLLAQRDGLDPDVRDRFARAGLSHLLAISGLHVGLIAGILLLVAGALRAGKRGAAAVAAVGTVAYVALLGAPHSAARAALQIVLVLIARAVQRPTRTEALIAAAALAILAVDPGALLRPGFQLSFAGVAGILALRRPLLRRLGTGRGRGPTKPARRWLADGLATSVAATLATAPIVAWHFGRVAPIGIVANLVAIPLLGAAVPALAVALLAGWVWLPAGRFLAGAGELLLALLDRTATLAAAVPAGTVAVLPASALALTAAVAAGYALSRRVGAVRPVVRGGVWAAAAVAALAVAPLRPSGDRVEVHLIDVGQGDAIAIRSPAARWVLVDAGVARADYDAGAKRVVPYLAGRGAARLEGMIISHPDADHMGGAEAVMESLRPRWVGGPAVVAGKSRYLELLARARAASLPWLAAVRGMELELDGMRLTVLYPDRAGLAVEDANDASVVLRVEYGEFAALLTGDAPTAVEDRLVRRYGRGLDADVLKVGHHGSRTSTSPALLGATGARTALISAGRSNRYGHPHGTVLARLRDAGVAVYRTDRDGTVVVRGTSDGRVRIMTERERRGG